ncbi:cell division protein FtsH [bacterium]|nr:cell division protein FtsH [bacterium]
MKYFKCFTFLYFLIAPSNAFLKPIPTSNTRSKIMTNLQIDNEMPSFIAQKIYKEFSSYGSPWSFTKFVEELNSKGIEGITFISQDNNIKGLVAIDNHHNTNEYDLQNMHNVKIVPDLVDNVLHKLDLQHITYDFIDTTTNNGLFSFIPGFIQFFFIFYLISSLFSLISSRGGGGGFMNTMNPMDIVKGKHTDVNTEKIDVKFDDVAGCDEAKNELVEVVDFLKNPEKYESAGAKIPRGILLEGPPGTGKTLLAQAVAGESGVSFLYASSSQFIEMFVGVGASRVRELFKKAKEKTPCVIFLDELDAVGRQRGTGLAGGNDEREQTLNEILTNMDGFEKNEGIVIIAATNRADILDSALTRPGRFDRKVVVGLPDKEGRREILDIHFRNKILRNSTYLDNIAKLTNGFSGADLSNLANEAAILSVRANNTNITTQNMYDAFEKMTIGLPANKDTRPKEIINMISYHEMGHAIITYLFSDMFELQAVTINANKNGAGGYTLFTPKDKYESYPTKKYILSNIMIALGGRAAEYILQSNTTFYNNKYVDMNVFQNLNDLYVTTGASNDLKQANSLARRYVSLFGMGKNIALYDSANTGQPFLGRNLATNNDKLSEYSKESIDKEIENIVSFCYYQAVNILLQNRKQMFKLVKKLNKEKTIYKQDFDGMDIKFN